MKLTITAALPDPLLLPNGAKRGAWYAKAKSRLSGVARQQAHDGALQAMMDAKLTQPRWIRASIRVTFYVKDKRGTKADQDGRISQCKWTLDGIAAAGAVANDRGFVWMSPPIVHRIDPALPRIEVEIEELPHA